MFDAQAIVLFLLGQVFTAAGVYAAIRADLREALVRVNILERWKEHVEERAARNPVH
jgi:hypothetical protein